MNRMANKIIFLAAISDAFKDEEDRELNAVGKIDIPEDGNATPILTDLFYAFKAFYTQISGDNVDPIEFIGVLMRLVFQDQIKDNSEASETEDNSSDDFSDMLEDGEEDDYIQRKQIFHGHATVQDLRKNL